jgi:hypothetical protein
LQVLDADQDGKLSQQEIRAAGEALLKLDRDGDGEVSRQELEGSDQRQGGEARRVERGGQGGISRVSPSRAEPGARGLQLVIQLSADAWPPLPPADVPPQAVTVGVLRATQIVREGTTVTASLDIPADTRPGRQDVVVEFPTPGGMVLRLQAAGAVTISAMQKGVAGLGSDPSSPLPYVVVDTGQDLCYDSQRETTPPRQGQAFYGQDAQYQGPQPRYRDNGDGTVSDLNTGLVWQKDPGDKRTYPEAKAGAAKLRLAGHEDWRLPTIKELYSLIDFRGSMQSGTPYIDTRSFTFEYPDTADGHTRAMDAQYWSATEYVGTTMRGAATVFGVNFADGRIKGYPRDRGRTGAPTKQFVRYVRGNPAYGTNDFVDNGDGTITDRATGLMWQKADSGKAMDWEEALAYAEGLECGGHSDWRLPNAKELQSIVDYTRAPAATDPAKRGPAIASVFGLTEPESWFWSSTTHLDHNASFAVYLAFGRAFGVFPDRHGGGRRLVDVHGAGAQRSDPKSGDPKQWIDGFGPQRDQRRILNYVRAVRGGPAG